MLWLSAPHLLALLQAAEQSSVDQDHTLFIYAYAHNQTGGVSGSRQ